MKAVILAAGEGSRLGSLTKSLPKPLISVHGKTVLQHNIELCRKHNISQLFINTHHHAEKITSLFGNGTSLGVHITYSFEEELLGTSGALWNFAQDLRDGPFYVLYGDNYSSIDLKRLEEEYAARECMGVIAFHQREDTSAGGVAEFGPDRRVVRFVEKPGTGESLSHWVNAGIYLLSPLIFEHIPAGVSDFARDVLPRLLTENIAVYGVWDRSEVYAFDTPEMYDHSMVSLK